MLSLDDGVTWVNPDELEGVSIGSYTPALRRVERKAGITLADKRKHYVRAVMKSGRLVEGEFLGEGADGIARASRIVAGLVR